MYLYKVYLHCQECLGTERLQFLAARSSLRGQDLKWLPSGLLKCRRPACLAKGKGQPCYPGGSKVCLKRSQKCISHIHRSWYHNFLFLFLLKLFGKTNYKALLEYYQLENGDKGSYEIPLTSTLQSHMCPQCFLLIKETCFILWIKVKLKTPGYIKTCYRKTWAKPTFSHLQWHDFDMDI